MQGYDINNKKIAEFLGSKLITNDPMFMGGNVPFYSLEIDCRRNYRPCELKYHTSWDWLHLVIDKIKALYVEGEDFNNYSGVLNLRIWQSIDEVYTEVVSFIQFYNTQQIK